MPKILDGIDDVNLCCSPEASMMMSSEKENIKSTTESERPLEGFQRTKQNPFCLRNKFGTPDYFQDNEEKEKKAL